MCSYGCEGNPDAFAGARWRICSKELFFLEAACIETSLVGVFPVDNLRLDDPCSADRLLTIVLNFLVYLLQFPASIGGKPVNVVADAVSANIPILCREKV